MTARGRPRRIVDWLLYVVIAIVIYGVVAIYALHQVHAGRSTELPLKWLGFAAMSAYVFGYAFHTGWRTRSGPKFWLLLGAFFAVHTGVGIVVLMRVDDVPLLIYALLTYVEYVLLMNCLDFLLRSDPKYR